MRQTIPIGFVLFVVGIVSGGSPLVVCSAEPMPEAATKWEYLHYAKADLLALNDNEKKDLTAALNYLGDDGWELAAVDGQLYIFKRPKVTAKQIEEVKRRIQLAEAEVEGWKDRVAWSERMVKKGYLTERHVQEEKALLQAAEIALEKARKELKASPMESKPEK